MRIVVAEDHALFRGLLVTALETAGHAVVASVGSAEQLLAKVPIDVPDLVIFDVEIPQSETGRTEYGLGVDVAGQLRQAYPTLALVALTAFDELVLAERVLRLGSGVGFFLKQGAATIDRFLEALEDVAAGGTRVDDDIVRKIIAGRRESLTAIPTDDEPIQRLSARELEILELIAIGRSNDGISRRLRIESKTVEGHVNSIYRKLGITTQPADELILINRRVIAALRFLRWRENAS